MPERKLTRRREKSFPKDRMHEVSIALNILEIISDHCIRNGYSKIQEVNIRIGRASGIMPDALIFAFDAVKGDSIAADALLNIEEVPVSGVCRDCNKRFAVDKEYVLCCPLCQGKAFSITGGREMDVVDLEVS